jgi:transcriptional regulator with XRE-family HTH domain
MINTSVPLEQEDITMERNELNRKIGQNIRKYRLKTDISQENLALSAGLYPAYLGRLERGEKCPTIDTLYKICNALGVAVSEMLCFENETENANAQAKARIENALKKIPDNQQIKVAEIIENIAEIADGK